MTDKTPLLADDEIKELARKAGFVPDWAIANCHEQFKRLVTLVAERAAAAEREAIILLADEMDVERTEYCMNVYEEGEQYKHNLLDAIRARSRA